MSVLTQGTHVFLLHDGAVTRIRKAISINPGSAPAGQIDDTTLDDTVFMQNRASLREPGQGSLSLRADPGEASHVTLFELSETAPSPRIRIAIGWADGTEPPTAGTGGGFDFPAGRTFTDFECQITDFPFDFQQNATVATEVTLQRTGGISWTPKGGV